MTKKHKGLTGYSLHAKRFRYTGKDGIRTIKYPLKNPLLKNELQQEIKADYLSLNGPININDWLNLDQSTSYSLFDFWLDSLRAGIIFSSSFKELTSVLHKYYQRPTPAEQLFSEIPDQYRAKLNQSVFIENVINKTGFRSNSTPKSISRRFTKCLLPEYQETQVGNDLVATMLNGVYDRSKDKARSKEDQQKFWNKEFNLDINLKTSNQPNITFFPLPQLKLDTSLGPIESIDRIKHKFKVKEWEDIYPLLGLDNNFNAFSNYFNQVLKDLKSDQINKLKKQILAVINVWQDESKLKERLKWLSHQAKKLPDPKVTRTWSDYRSNFGGKIQSWLSNYLRQKNLIYERLADQEEEISQLLAIFKENFKQESEDKQLIIDLTTLSKQILKIIREKRRNDESFTYKAFSLYRDLIADLRTKLNYYHQNNNETEEEVNQAFPHIYSNVELVPQFYGQAKQERYKRFVNSAKLISQGFNFLSTLKPKLQLKEQNINQNYLRIKLESLRQQYFRANTNHYKPCIEGIITKYIDRIPEENHKIYKHPKSTDPRTSQIEIDLNGVDFCQELQQIIKQLNLEPGWKHLSPAQLIDYIEILKIKWSILNKLNLSAVELNSKNLTFFQKATTYLETFGNRFEKEDLATFIQSHILSELKGAVNLISRENFVSRNTCQFINSHKKFTIVYIPLEKSFGKDHIPLKLRKGFPQTPSDLLSLKSKDCFLKYLSYYPHHWGVIERSNLKRADKSDLNALVVFSDKSNKNFKIKYANPKQIFSIRTSTYQLQFLEKFLRPPTKWKNLELTTSEPSLITEQKYEVNWDRTNLTVDIKPFGEDRLFYSLPFNIVPKVNTQQRSEAIDNRNTYLGIDVGEYGLAWSVIQFDKEKQHNQLANGFFYSHELRKIRDHVQNMKTRQLKGTFGMPSTSLARIRESAIHSLRNKIHDIALRYNAKPVYERQISYFETGSNRVSKIYRSIKVADVHPENPADDAVREEVWGKRTKYMGTHLNAYATSQTCSKCHKTVTDDLISGQIFKVTRHIYQRIYQVKNGKQSLLIYSDKNLEAGQTLDKKETRRLAQQFMRPPADSDVLEWTKINLPKDFIHKRGNSAVFVCPFCEHVADADIQAATNIAFRSFLADSHKKDDKNTDEFSYVESLKNYSKKHAYPVNELSFSSFVD